MKKQYIALGIVFLITCVGLSGCQEDAEEDNEPATSSSMTGQEFLDDVKIQETSEKLVIDYQSFEDNDSVHIHDTIDDIVYDAGEDITQILLYVTPYKILDNTLTSLIFDFRGNLTDLFSIGDTVNISFHIEERRLSNMQGSEVIFQYNLELAREYDGTYEYGAHEQKFYNLTYLSTNFPPEILPKTCITQL